MKLLSIVWNGLTGVAGFTISLLTWLVNRRQVVVLCYHTISSDFPGEMTPAKFARHIELLLASGYTFISIAQYEGWLTRKTTLPKKAVLMTFDDGFANHITNAIPLLKKYSIPAINFIAADKMGGQYDWDGIPAELYEPLMNELQVNQWLAAGFTIGSHSLTHEHLDRLSRSEKIRQIVDSKKILELKFQTPINWLCYPFGAFDGECVEIAKDCGYFGAFACYRHTNPWQSDRYAIRRLLVYPSWSDKKFLYKTSRKFELVAALNLTLKKIRSR